MDMKDFHRLCSDAIEYLVRITHERCDAYILIGANAPGTFWPSPNSPNGHSDAGFHSGSKPGIVLCEVRKYFLEVIEGWFGKDDLHVSRYLANTASTSLSLAYRPSAAACSPRLMPASSCAVGRYSPESPASNSNAMPA